MVTINPFRALRYDPAQAGRLGDVLSPPYDVITPEEQERLYQASPHNVIRLILGKESAQDSPADNRYTRARRDFDAWRSGRVLVQDPAPAIYALEQRFQDGGQAHTRLGFIALFQLDGEGGPPVYRHEATLSAPKADRTKLLEAVPANLEPIFCVYPDEGGAVQRVLEALTRTAPPSGTATLGSEAIRFWVVTDHDLVQEITQRLAPVHVLIADGHHRFEVAYAHRSRYPALMSYFVSMADPALVVRPIHRVVEARGASMVPTLTPLCALEPAEDLEALLGWLQAQSGAGRFGFFDGQRYFRVTVTEGALQRWVRAPTVPAPLAGLDVSILHGFLLPSAGLNGSGVRYTADAHRALHEVTTGSAGSAWWLRGIPLRHVYELASQGLVLSPKSTYFYPKVPSGIAINLLAGLQ